MRDDFIARSDAKGHQDKPDCVRAIADTNGELGAGVLRQLALEAFQHWTLDIVSAQQDFLQVSVDFLLDVFILADMTVKLDFHAAKAIWQFWALTSNFVFSAR